MEGVPVLLYVLSFPTHAVTDADCAAVIHLLQTLGRCGRSFKEYISHCGGERSVVQCCIARSPRVSCDSDLLLTSHAMLLEQCSGNPNSTTATFAALHLLLDSNHVSLVRMASQIVCELVSTKSPHYDARVTERIWDLVPTAITLLGNDSVKVQYDALELVHILLHDLSNHVTSSAVDTNDHISSDHNLPKTADEFYEVECFMHAKSHVVRICHCLDSILLHCPPFAATTIGLHGVDALVYVVLASTEGSVKWQAACFTLLRLCITHEVHILSDTAQLTTTKDMHEIELDTCMEMLVGDAAHQSTIWRHLYNQKWPLRPVVMLERDDEYDDHTLDTLAAQVEATITPVRQDDGLLADETSPPQHGDHYYIQKLHTHFQKYRRPVQEAAHNHA
ncbi:hypothetical protein DYB30_008991 [Aphanomyces astaci]|uniref:Uncharacterized protein n=1 Tax=Aphanomyces astaci TaxID=112090 RepID=A0A397DIY8_APHAT|nr:hypothetical protein DYB30_008991 [Aphanomyces astaci]RHY85584.1 hypothetical protein DYB26_006104 [Aphanomyces astaci]